MQIYQIIILAILQGLTEFLPVSSSAHLILLPKLFNWQDQGLEFDVVVHLGTLVALCWYYRQDIKLLCQPNGKGLKYLGYLCLATVPVGLTGFILKDWIEINLRSTQVIAGATILFGVLLGLSDWLGRNRHIMLENAKLSTWLGMGLAQMLSLIPGTSRSGITLTTGLALGLGRETAARISFWMAGPVIIAAAGLGIISWLKSTNGMPAEHLILGFVISCITGYICIALFMKLLLKIGVWPFVVYRLILGTYLLKFL